MSARSKFPWEIGDFSFKFTCEDAKIYQTIYEGKYCDDTLDINVIKRKIIDYTLASCAEVTFCDTAQFSFKPCANITNELWYNDTESGGDGTMAVDTCFGTQTGDFAWNGYSWMWKCTDHMLTLNRYSGTTCDDNSFLDRDYLKLQTNHVCILGMMMRNNLVLLVYLTSINCTTTPCAINQGFTDSYNLCKIFLNTNIDQRLNWWDPDYNDYCYWAGPIWQDSHRRRLGANDQYPDSDEFRCYGDDIYYLDLSNYTGIINGTLDFSDNHTWPDDLEYLNLRGLELGGIWDWASLQTSAYSMYGGLDISDNNFEGTVDLEYIVGKSLDKIDITNNLFTGYIDWEALAYIMTWSYSETDPTFYAGGNDFDGYADFSMFPPFSDFRLEFDKDFVCHPYKYICVANDTYDDEYYDYYWIPRRRLARGLDFVPAPRGCPEDESSEQCDWREDELGDGDASTVYCSGRRDCQQTCMCADGTVAYPTNFYPTPVLGMMECGDEIISDYNITDTGIPFNFGDWSHYYLVRIPPEYGQVNITFDISGTNFDARLAFWTWTGEEMDDSDGAWKRSDYIWNIDETELMVEVIGGNYYYTNYRLLECIL